MDQRIEYERLAPGGVAALRRLEAYVRQSELEPSLLELVRVRASQLNGCAYCVDMHTQDARAEGESEQRLYAVAVWREAPFFTDRERAALEWTEAVTRLEGGIDEDVQRRASEQFDERELVELTFAVVAINAWNRLAVPFHRPAGTYRRREHAPAPSPDPPGESP